jgi:hypothetical protein
VGDKPNSLFDIAGEPKVQITIVKDVIDGIDIMRTNIFRTTIRDNPKIDPAKQ